MTHPIPAAPPRLLPPDDDLPGAPSAPWPWSEPSSGQARRARLAGGAGREVALGERRG